MKVLLLAQANSVHTHRWVEALHARGHMVTLASQQDPRSWQPPAGVTLHRLPRTGMLGYFANVPAVRALIREVRPSLVHAHYASGYGTTAALARFRPTLLSVWGSDVFEFPYQSRLKGALLRYNLRRADRLASTSHAMAEQLRRLAPELAPAFVTPFGVDTHRFRPMEGTDPALITIGTVKTLDHTYGVDLLVRAFAELQRDADLLAASLVARLRLLLVGAGPARASLEALAEALCETGSVTFVGAVPHPAVPGWLNTLDVYVAASRAESFGVAALEASACGVPVVVSDVGGLPEVVDHGRTGLVVPAEDVGALAAALKRLVLNPRERRTMGDAGRSFVQERYDWERSIDTMEMVYRRTAGSVVNAAGDPRDE